MPILEAGTYQSPGIDIMNKLGVISIAGTISGKRPIKLFGCFFGSATLRWSTQESDIEEHACFQSSEDDGVCRFGFSLW
jgi:hypothetical protein